MTFRNYDEMVRRSIFPVATLIKIRHYDRTTTEYDETTQEATSDYDDTEVYADVQNVTTRQILNSGGKVTPNTKQIILPADTEIAELDDIIISSTTLQAIEVKFLSNRYVVLANKVLE